MDVRADLAEIARHHADRARRPVWEAWVVEPGLQGMGCYRLGRYFYQRKRYFLARCCQALGRVLAGVDIHPGARIGKRCMILHGGGVVVGETAVLGDDCVLTGWAGGPAALALARRTEMGVARQALRSLGEIFGTPLPALERAWCGHALHNWSRDPFSRGAYSFTAAGLDDAAGRLREPLEETLFFAGEATADGAEIGTVHGALASGLRAAAEVRRVLG